MTDESKTGTPQTSRDIASLEEELHSYREERENIRAIIGQIGGANQNKKDRLIEIIFIVLLASLLTHDIGSHFGLFSSILPFQISIEFAVLLVSVKIIWMIHKQAKVEHFQFWILNSIEFRLNEIAKRLNEIEKKS